MNRLCSFLPLLALIGASSACRIQTGGGASTYPPPPPASAPGSNQGAGQPATSPAGSPAAGGTVAATAECPRPEDHCLPNENLLFALAEAWNGGWRWAELVTQTTPPDGAGEAKFFRKRDGGEMVSRWFYATRRATPADLKVGQMIVVFDGNKSEGAYFPPVTQKEALGDRWWAARITSIAGLNSGGRVQVSGGYLVSATNVRLIQGDTSDTAVVDGTEDAQFLRSGHWIVSTAPLKSSGWQWVEAAAAIASPSPQSKNEGHFLFTRDGKQAWSSHAWRTRVATNADLKNGTRVFVFDGNKQGGIYSAPTDRRSALGKRWYTGVVTDASTLYKGVVTVAGKYQVAINAIRVAQ